MLRRQSILADFGEVALRSDDLDAVLTEGCRLVGEATGAGRAKVLEIEHERRCLYVRAGVGWGLAWSARCVWPCLNTRRRPTPSRWASRGRELIERALPCSLSATSSFQLGPRSLQCVIDLPLADQPAGGEE